MNKDGERKESWTEMWETGERRGEVKKDRRGEGGRMSACGSKTIVEWMDEPQHLEREVWNGC